MHSINWLTSLYSCNATSLNSPGRWQKCLPIVRPKDESISVKGQRPKFISIFTVKFWEREALCNRRTIESCLICLHWSTCFRLKGFALVDSQPLIEVIYFLKGGEAQLKLGLEFQNQHLHKIVDMFYGEEKIKSTWLKFKMTCKYWSIDFDFLSSFWSTINRIVLIVITIITMNIILIARYHNQSKSYLIIFL